jgi:hypothetical protein
MAKKGTGSRIPDPGSATLIKTIFLRRSDGSAGGERPAEADSGKSGADPAHPHLRESGPGAQDFCPRGSRPSRSALTPASILKKKLKNKGV